jgi:hypothetical protein
MAGHEETPTHIAKSTSMHSTPSHHSALSGVEIDYDMERFDECLNLGDG